MKKKLYIITGASRGIGKAIIETLSVKGNHVVGIARSFSGEPTFASNQLEHTRTDLSRDLSDLTVAAKLIPEIFSSFDPKDYCEISLINNAGVLEPVAPCGSYEDTPLLNHMQLNLIAPMILTNAFIKHTRNLSVPRTVLNISSGAASNPYHGWSAYCASKAGLDMFTRCTGLEQQAEAHGIRILSIAPGVVDTQMQEILRSVPSTDFPDRERFVRMKEKGTLREPADVARQLIQVMERTNIPTGSVLDLRDLEE